MNKQQVTKAIEKVLNSSKIGVLSTAHHNKP
ncbi:MAG: general stress protein, partial [Staphylococcus epidermidis]|nr:general stress protein [Staphylococcus epidermidis]